MANKRSFGELKKQMSLDEFNDFCQKLTKEYANSEARFSRSYLCNYYDISKDCYYKVMEFAVVMDLVTEEEFNKMLNKSVANQNMHSEGAVSSSIAKYAKMYAARCEYIALSFIDDEVRRIAKDFADNPDISKKDIAKINGIPTKALDIILAKAIEQNIVDDTVVDAIQKRSLNNTHQSNVEKAKKYFEALRKKREAFKTDTTFE